MRACSDDTKERAVVPASVVQRGPQGTYAYVIKPDKTVEMRPIKVGQPKTSQTRDRRRTAAGEQVVVDGQYKLQPGSNGRTDAPPPRQSAQGNRSATAREHRRANNVTSIPREVVNISEPFIRRPVATSLLMAGVILLGAARL